MHDKHAGDEPFVRGLRLIEQAADDDRNFVKKAVNMSLRAIGKRNPALNAAAVAVARRLADSPEAAARWIGKDALRELTSPAVHPPARGAAIILWHVRTDSRAAPQRRRSFHY